MEMSSGVIIAIVAAAVGLLFLVIVVVVIVVLMKRKKSNAASSEPAQFTTPSQPQVGVGDMGQQWSQPQQQWGEQAEITPQDSFGQGHQEPEAWQSGGVVEPQPDVATPPMPPPFPEPAVDQDSYSTSPGAEVNDPLPNPDLFMTTPNTPRHTGMVTDSASLRADDGTVIQLGPTVMRVGRHPECEIVIPTPGASRHHAEFELLDGAWTVTDLNSGNGTYVNGVRIKSHQLTNGDEIRIDQTRFVYSG